MDEDSKFDAVANALADECRRFQRERRPQRGQVLADHVLLTHLDDLATPQAIVRGGTVALR
jgi:hypothetical protein